MRRITMLLAFLLVCSSPVFAQLVPPQIPVLIFSLSCQSGTTYGTSGSRPTCKSIALFGPALEDCKAPGIVTSGPCNADGVCGGSAVCCAGAKIGETCSEPIGGGSGVAQVDSCAIATEAACDALSPAGERATVSVPFTTCTRTETVPGGECLGPPPG